METITLRDLEPGDIFIHAKGQGKNKQKFIVRSMPEFNPRHGSPTRKCIKLGDNSIVGKACKLKVIKTGESFRKQKFIEKYMPKPKQ